MESFGDGLSVVFSTEIIGDEASVTGASEGDATDLADVGLDLLGRNA